MNLSTRLLLMFVILVRAAVADLPAAAHDVPAHSASEDFSLTAAMLPSIDDEALRAIASWLSAEFGLTIAELPDVELVAKEGMSALAVAACRRII